MRVYPDGVPLTRVSSDPYADESALYRTTQDVLENEHSGKSCDAISDWIDVAGAQDWLEGPAHRSSMWGLSLQRLQGLLYCGLSCIEYGSVQSLVEQRYDDCGKMPVI